MPEDFTKDQIKSGVFEVVNMTLRIPRERITTDSKLFKDLGAESIDLLDIRFELERVFNLNIKDSEISDSVGKDVKQESIHELLTVGRLIEFVENKLNL